MSCGIQVPGTILLQSRRQNIRFLLKKRFTHMVLAVASFVAKSKPERFF